ncbi:hypothetical protein JL100_032325 (plasmid) [Skermanella mucosa]|uniref:hypothetical protein n=1 Tax=Skermanella mucosa TaxID=1789672 RepID=UPI00192B3D95|nr:hypothetical protein [Skermanella mucosa]UEM24766.1 hypothetical protein JL100_032325 [Skermanella mucosa]
MDGSDAGAPPRGAGKNYEKGLLKLWLASLAEMFFEEAVSEEISKFVRGKRRAQLKDPRLCVLHVPPGYGFGPRRVPLEAGHLEVYHPPNVEAVGIACNAIECMTPDGIRTADDTLHELNIITLATGFDSGARALTRIDIRRRGGRPLRQARGRDIRTTMGLQVHGYPNLFTTVAPSTHRLPCAT